MSKDNLKNINKVKVELTKSKKEKKVYINTLTPNFKFLNHKGNEIVATNSVFL